jgi:uncharacterized RDD family membrane protein YckC
MQTISVRTTQNVFIHYPLASIGDRLLAHLIDRLFLILYSFAVVALFIRIELDIWWVWLICLAFPWFFYSLLFEIFMNGQTPGKRFMKIQVVRMDGTPATVGDYLLRWLFAAVDIYMLSGAIGIIAIAVGGKGQRIGDIVAGTTVVKLIQQKEITAADVFVTTEDTYTPTFAQVTQLNEKDIELIQRALAANRNQGNLQPVILVTEKIKSLLGIQTDLPPVQFLYTIVKDFHHLTAR